MKQLATDPAAVRQLDGLAQQVQGKPLDTISLVHMAMRDHAGYDEAMMTWMLREWVGMEKQPVVAIRGTVVDAENRQPIPFPRVFSGDRSAVADQNGRFQIPVRMNALADGVALWIDAEGHASGQYLARQADGLTIPLRRDVPFFGKVVDQVVVRWKVPRSARAWLEALMVLGDTKPEEFRHGSHGIFQVRTDREGRFSFLGVPEIDSPAARARNLEEDLLRTLARDHEFNNPRWPFTIKVRDVAGKTLSDLTLSIRAKGTSDPNDLSAIVNARRGVIDVDSSKRMIQFGLDDAEIQAFKPGVIDRDQEKDSMGIDLIGDVKLQTHGDRTHVNADQVEIPLPADWNIEPVKLPVHLEVSHPRFQTASVSATAPTSADAAPLIRLEPGAAITAQVFDEKNHPVDDAMVQVRDFERGQSLVTAFTNREGMCHTPASLKPGRHWIVVQSANHAAAWRTILAGEVLSAHQFILEPGEFIIGKVVSAGGDAVAGAAVGWAQPVTQDPRSGRSPELDTMTAAGVDGTFRLGPLPPGEFVITAVARSPRWVGKVSARAGATAVITLSPE